MITLTSEAAAQIRKLLEKEQAQGAALRVFVAGGGCSGWSYGMSLEASPAEDDEEIQAEGVRLVIDPQSLPLLQGSEIDYAEGLMASGFVINNPNAVSSCACGQSFSAEGNPGAAHACH